MLRSLIAIIVATIIGLSAAKFVEGAGRVMLDAGAAPIEPGAVLDGSVQLVLLVGWFFGGLISAALALLLARRWAPVGIVASATMMLTAIIALMGFSAHWLMWPASLVTVAASGVLAIRLTRASYAYPQAPKSKEVFND